MQAELFLGDLRCYRCENLLSFPPIVLLDNGRSVCGLCSNAEEQRLRRQLNLENILQATTFPCCYKESGCKERLKFGESQEHKKDCIYRPMQCPLGCNWQDNIHRLKRHLEINHTGEINNRLQFRLQINDENEDGTLFAYIERTHIAVRYSYSSASSVLMYDMRHLNTDIESISVRISLINESDLIYRTNLKGRDSLLFNATYYLELGLNAGMITLSTYVPVLNNPSCIIVKFDLCKVKRYSGNKNTIKNQEFADNIVDYKIINKLRCHKCRCYLLPPLYRKLDSTELICVYCRDKCEDDRPIQIYGETTEKVMKANFPCRWRGCRVIMEGAKIIDHEMSCESKIFKCPVCDDYVKRKRITEHMKQHHYHYFEKYFVQSLKYNAINAFTIIDDHVFIFNIWVAKCYIELTSGIDAILEFQHDHCKIKSIPFIVEANNKIGVRADELPQCFGNIEDLDIIITLPI